MASVLDCGRAYLTRKEAADYVTARWFICSAAALAKYAVKAIGPEYGLKGGAGEAQYTRDALDAWAKAFVRKRA